MKRKTHTTLLFLKHIKKSDLRISEESTEKHCTSSNLIKRLLIIMIIVFGYNNNLTAQNKFKVSLSGGLNDNKVTYDAKDRVETNYTSENGNYIKANFLYNFHRKFSVQAGITYLNKNYKYERTGPYEGPYTKYDSKYINIPIMFGCKPLDFTLKDTKFDFEIFAGTYIGWWSSLKREGKQFIFAELQNDGNFPLEEFSESYDFDENEREFNRLDYGLQAEARLSYNIYKQIDIFLEYSYLYGLSDNEKSQVRKTSTYYYTTSNYGIGVAYKF